MRRLCRNKILSVLNVILALFLLSQKVAVRDVEAREALIAGTVESFNILESDIHLKRLARPATYFDKVGRKFALLGFEDGTFEAWAYPLKLIRNFEFSFLVGTSTTPIKGRDIVRFIDVEPEATTLTYIYQSFMVKAHFITAINEPGALILLEVNSTVPLTVVCGFLPVLVPMWPAGLGGQYAYWDRELKAYLISEPTRQNHAYVGSPAAQGISYTPAHMLSDQPNEFKIEILEPQHVRGRFIPIALAGGKGKRDGIKSLYQKLVADPGQVYREARKHYSNLRDKTLKIQTPSRKINLAYEWAKIALDNLIVDNPDLGVGMVAGLGPSGAGGRPGFGWFFGVDAYLNSFSLNSIGMTAETRNIVDFTRKWQRKDGKMAHELSQAAGYIKWWDEYPYGYIHGETTPYYIVAVDDYLKKTGDLNFLKTCWPAIVRAYNWCLTTDADGDGLMDNSKAGLGALEFGALTGIQTDIYLAAVWTKACQSLSDLAEIVGDKMIAQKASRSYDRALKAWREKFWDRENNVYSFAFNKNGQLVSEITPWSAYGLTWGLASTEKAIATLARLNRADLTTDWGIRILSEKSKYFEPLNYNYGACWPFLAGWVASALYEYGYLDQAYRVLMSNVEHTFDNSLGVITELFSGFHNVWPEEGVPHQGFSTSGVVLPLVRGLLGLKSNVQKNELFFSPKLPADWPEISIDNWLNGTSNVSLSFSRDKGKITVRISTAGLSGQKFICQPALALGTKINKVRLNRLPCNYQYMEEKGAQSAWARIEFILTGNDTVEIEFTPGPELIVPPCASNTGDTNAGLKIIKKELQGLELAIHMEGLKGRKYELTLLNSFRIEEARGATLSDQKLEVVFPENQGEGQFASQTVILKLKY